MALLTVADLCQTLAGYAPLELAEGWDNVGLLVGHRDREVSRVMVALTITPAVVAEAVAEQVDMIIVHHPLPFKPLAKLTDDSPVGQMLLRLIEQQIAVFSAHTAWDSAAAGINQQYAEQFELAEIAPLQPLEARDDAANSLASAVGSGRFGTLVGNWTLEAVARRVETITGAALVRMVGQRDRLVQRVAFACGSGGSFLQAAIGKGCDVLVTGETTFHTCLAAEAEGICLVLTGHFASERFAMEAMASRLAEQHDRLTVWASVKDCDPIDWL